MPAGAAHGRWLPGPLPYVINRAGIPLFPLSLTYAVAQPLGDLFHRLLEAKRRNVALNYAHILGRGPGDPLVQQLTHECFRHFSRYVAEMIHVQGWDNDVLEDRVEVRGEEHFAEAQALGKGVIFVSGHMGSTEIAASLAVLNGFQITAVSEQIRPQFLMDWAVASRAGMGITILPIERAGIRLLRTLRRGQMVAFVVDAGVNRGGGVSVTFFGRETVFPTGPARLARMSGAPILFGLGARRPGGRFAAHIEPPLLSDRALAPEEDIRRLTQRIAAIFERYVHLYPGQWYAFRQVWPD